MAGIEDEDEVELGDEAASPPPPDPSAPPAAAQPAARPVAAAAAAAGSAIADAANAAAGALGAAIDGFAALAMLPARVDERGPPAEASTAAPEDKEFAAAFWKLPLHDLEEDLP